MLEYIFFSIYLLIPLLVAIAAIGSTFFLFINMGFGIFFVMLAALLEAFLLSGNSINIGINLFVADLIPLMLFAIGVLRWLYIRHEKSSIAVMLPASIWASLLFVSFARGVSIYGAAAGNDFRYFFYFLAIAIYTLSFQRTQISFPSLVRYWIRTAIIMAFIAVFRWAADALGISIGPDWSDFMAGGKLRVLPSGQALFIATGLLLLISRSLNQGSGPLQKLQIGFMGLVVLVLQHRSVWIATLVGFIVIVGLAEVKDKKRLLVGLGWLSALSIVVGLALSVGKLDGVSEDLQRSVQEVGDKKSTIAGRMQGWQELINGFVESESLDMAIGKTMGSGYERYLSLHGRTVKENPHNFYVHVLIRTGFVGLTIFCSVLFMLARRAVAGEEDPTLRYQRRTLLALLLMNVFYIAAYPIRFEQALIFGFAMVLFNPPLNSRSMQITSQSSRVAAT